MHTARGIGTQYNFPSKNAQVNAQCKIEHIKNNVKSMSTFLRNKHTNREPKIKCARLRMAFRLNLSSSELKYKEFSVEKIAKLDAVQFNNFIARLSATSKATSCTNKEKSKLLYDLASNLRDNFSSAVDTRFRCSEKKLKRVLDEVLTKHQESVGFTFTSWKNNRQLLGPKNTLDLCAFYKNNKYESTLDATFSDLSNLIADDLELTIAYIRWLFPLPTDIDGHIELKILKKNNLLDGFLYTAYYTMLNYWCLNESDETDPLLIELTVDKSGDTGRWLKLSCPHEEIMDRVIRSMAFFGYASEVDALIKCLKNESEFFGLNADKIKQWSEIANESKQL